MFILHPPGPTAIQAGVHVQHPINPPEGVVDAWRDGNTLIIGDLKPNYSVDLERDLILDPDGNSVPLPIGVTRLFIKSVTASGPGKVGITI